MFVLLQRRDRAELVLSVDVQDDPALEAFMDRFNISKECAPLINPPPCYSSYSTLKVRGLAV